MSVWMLRDVIWTCFFTKPVCWQNSFVILENSYLPHMRFILAEMWQVDSSLSQESKTIEFALNGHLQLKIFKLEWSKVNTSRQRNLTLKAVISMLLFFFLALHFQKGMDVRFLIPLESFYFDLQSSRSAQNIDRRSNLLITFNLFIFAFSSNYAFKT